MALFKRCCIRGNRTRLALFALVTLSFLFGLAGCTRRFFRKRADAQVDELMAEKDKYPDWKIDQYHVYPDPRARYADWTNPDRPPMPPDDPAAYDLSPHPQYPPLHSGVQYIEGTGYLDILKQWDIENRARLEKERQEVAERRKARGTAKATPEELSADEREAEIEKQIEYELARPVARDKAIETEPPPPAVTRPLIMNLENTVEMGFLNSREFQTVREELYLSALPVTAERFSFAAQPFLTEQIVREKAGRKSIDGRTNNWQFGTNAGFTKLFSTGALLLFNFANQTVYNLGRSPTGTTSVSTVSLDIVQPFLRGGGRAVTLEPLTQAERNLLYAIRDYMRDRQQYFVYFAAGQPAFIPGVQAGVAAITPNTVSSPGPFVPTAAALASVSSNPAVPTLIPGRGGVLSPIGGIGPTPQGFLGAVQERGQLVNSYKNIQSLRRFLRLFQVFLEGGLVNLVQVGQIEQQLLRSEEAVLGSQANYRTSLDQLKQQLGLPMTIPIDLDESDLQPVIRQTVRYEDLSADFDAFANQSEGLATVEPGQLRGRLRRLYADTVLGRGTKATKRVLEQWAEWEKVPAPKAGEIPSPLDRRLSQLREQRRRLLDRQASSGTLSPEDQRRLQALEFDLDLGIFELSLRYYESQPWLQLKDPDAARLRALRETQKAILFRVVQRNFLTLGEEPLRERQDGIRDGWPDLPAICVEGVDLLRAPEEEALAVLTRAALSNRLDLMNNRAQLVDSWRKIAVAANALLGTFNVDYHFDAVTAPRQAQPFNFPSGSTRHQLFFNFNAPLVRVLERNNYRSALIAYQQTRRNLMQNEDQVLFEVRLDLRSLRASANNYQRIQKRNIELAYQQVDQALQAFSQPFAPTGAGNLAGLIGPTAGIPVAGDPAALTQQLLSTQNSLLQAQNDLYNTWIGYLTTRMAFYRDLGIMPIDSRGVWIDANTACDCNAAPASPAPAGTPGRPPAGQPGLDRPEQLPPPRPFPAAQGAALGQWRQAPAGPGGPAGGGGR